MNRKLILASAVLTLAACGDDVPDAALGSSEYELWCQGFDEYMVELDRVMLQPSTPSNPESDEAQAMERMIEAFVEIPVPEPITEDWALAMPRNPTPPERQDPIEQTRARANSAEWIVNNCELSNNLDSALRKSIAKDREYLDGIPSTTG